MPVGLPLAAACFILGAFDCIAPSCAEYPILALPLPGGAVGDSGILIALSCTRKQDTAEKADGGITGHPTRTFYLAVSNTPHSI